MKIRPPLDSAAASRMAPKLRLVDVGCLAFSGKLLATAPPAPPMILSWDLADPNAVWLVAASILRILFPISLTIEANQGAEASSSSVPLAELNATYRLDYSAQYPLDDGDNDIPHYVGISGMIHMWPYLRADIQQMTTKLGLPPLVLPVLVSGQAASRVTVSQAREPRVRRSKTTAKLKKSKPRETRTVKISG